jgi:hypothetical protein
MHPTGRWAPCFIWDWVALLVLVAIGILLVQFGLGMWVDLFVEIPPHHPGGASNFFSGVFDSVRWGILHGRIALAIHAALGLALAVGIVHGILWNLKWGTSATLWITVVGAAFVVAAALMSGAFVTSDKDAYSLVMALFFGAATLCYAILIRLLLRSPDVGRRFGR